MVRRRVAEDEGSARLEGLVDTLGRPLRSNASSNGRSVDRDAIAKSFASSISAYIEQLGQLDLPPLVRARDPFKSHAWVSAAASTTRTGTR